MSEKALVAVVEGPKGKAEVFEIQPDATALMSEYEVSFGGKVQTLMTLGEASIVAHELAGAGDF
ncbi:MAG: hypothetical protein WD533_03290 [Dehalococcoidia bacterium]